MDNPAIDPQTHPNVAPARGDAGFDDDRFRIGTTHGLRLDATVTVVTCYRGRHLPQWIGIGSDHGSEPARITRFFRGRVFDSPDAFRDYCACLLKAPVTWDVRDAP